MSDNCTIYKPQRPRLTIRDIDRLPTDCRAFCKKPIRHTIVSVVEVSTYFEFQLEGIGDHIADGFAASI